MKRRVQQGGSSRAGAFVPGDRNVSRDTGFHHVARILRAVRFGWATEDEAALLIDRIRVLSVELASREQFDSPRAPHRPRLSTANRLRALHNGQ